VIFPGDLSPVNSPVISLLSWLSKSTSS